MEDVTAQRRADVSAANSADSALTQINSVVRHLFGACLALDSLEQLQESDYSQRRLASAAELIDCALKELWRLASELSGAGPPQVDGSPVAWRTPVLCPDPAAPAGSAASTVTGVGVGVGGAAGQPLPEGFSSTC